MKFSTQHLLRLLLITAMVLAPVQSAFSMQMSMPSDSPAIATSDLANSGEMQMFDENISKHGDCGNCQSSTHCSSCPMSLAIIQITPLRSVTSTRSHAATLRVSLNSSDLLPDYRPPRFS